MKTLTVLAIFGIVGPCLAADAPPNTPGRPHVEVPIGRLGYPIGTYLTIEGVQEVGFKTGLRMLAIDTISGYKLARPVNLKILNVNLPEGGRCVLKGYETGEWAGVPDGVPGAEGVQAIWQFRFYFHATSVDQPAGLKVGVSRD